MKLTRSIDLDALRAGAAAAVDEVFGARAARRLAAIHDTKAALAERRDPLLEQEAQARGMTLEALCALVLEKRREEHAAILALDAERLELKRRIGASTNAHEIRDMVEAARAAGWEPSQ